MYGRQQASDCKRDSDLIGYGDSGVGGPIIVNKSCVRMRSVWVLMEVCQEKDLLLAKHLYEGWGQLLAFCSTESVSIYILLTCYFLYLRYLYNLQFKSHVNSGKVASFEELTVALSLLQPTASFPIYVDFILYLTLVLGIFCIPCRVLCIGWIF